MTETRTANTDGYFITRPEMRALQVKLRQIPTLVRELDEAITRQTAFSDSTDSRPQDPEESPVDFNLHASDVAMELLGAVRTAVEDVCAQQQKPWPGEHRAGSYAVWLDHHIIDIALTETAARIDRDIHTAVKRARNAVDKPPPLEFAGPCQSDLPGVECDGVYVRPGTDAVKCRGCGVPCDVQQMQIRMRDEVAARLYDAHELSTALSIYVNSEVGFERIRNWVRRGKLSAVSGNGREALYRFHDALELWSRTAQKGA